MSLPEKPDPVRAWKLVEKLLAEEELERIAKLSDEEVDRELRAAGIDPSSVPTAEELMAGASARRDFAPAVPAASEKDLPRVVALPNQRRSTRWVWLVAAMLGAVALVLATAERAAIVAFFKGEPLPEILPDDEQPKPPTPREIAEKTRDEAMVACTEGWWALCGRKLDEAKKLDPAGESEPRVKQARGIIEEELGADVGGKKR